VGSPAPTPAVTVFIGMPQFSLDPIAALPHPVADRAMAEALPTADPATQRRLVLHLLQRRQGAGLLALVRHWDALGSESQPMIAQRIEVISEALRSAAAEPDVRSRLNVVAIIERTGRASLAYLLSGQLHHERPEVHRAAAGALLNLARAHQREPGETDLTGDEPRYARQAATLTEAIREACACFHQHRRRDVVLAAFCLADRMTAPAGDRLRDRLARPDGAGAAARDLLARPAHAVTADALLPLATIQPLREAVVRGLGAAELTERRDRVIRRGHLLLNPVIRQTVRKVRQSRRLVPTPAAMRKAEGPTAAAMARWIEQLAVTRREKIDALRELTAHAAPGARLSALGVLMRLEHPEADDLISSMCFDGEPAIARTALRHLVRQRWAHLMELSVRLITSGPPALRQVAETVIAPRGFERFWRTWADLPTATRRAAGRALMKVDRRFLLKLAERMDGPTADRMKAVMIARTLEQETYFEPKLIALAGDPEPRVASAAVAALHRLGDSPRAAWAVLHALDHPDDRVRANAVESLHRIDRLAEAEGTLRSMMEGRGNRSRAAAIEAMLDRQPVEATAALRRMLASAATAHRISALWVVERKRIAEVAAVVADMARQDADSGVRRRAARLLRQMNRWSDAATPSPTGTADAWRSAPDPRAGAAGPPAGAASARPSAAQASPTSAAPEEEGRT